MRRFALLALALAVGLAAAASPFASPDPDGLERVAADQGFLDRARPATGAAAAAPARGYAAPGIAGERLATGIAGFAGTLLVFALAAGAGAALRRAPGHHAPPSSGAAP